MSEIQELSNRYAVLSIAEAYCRDSRCDDTYHLRQVKETIINDSDITHDVLKACIAAIDILTVELT